MTIKNHGTALLAVALVALLIVPAGAQIPGTVKVESEYVTLATPYAEDFEDDDGGFTPGGDPLWEHGQPTVHVTPVTGQGPNVWGTNLDGNYPSRMCSTLDSPEIDLSDYVQGNESGVSTARLQFRHWYHLEERWDGGVLQASQDGADWRVLTPLGGYEDSMISSVVRACLGVEQGEPVFTGPGGTSPPNGNVWRNHEFDLSAYLGGPLHLRWVVGTDSSRERLGWYIDDVTIEVGAGVRIHVDVPETDDADTTVSFTPLTNLYITDFEDADDAWQADGVGWEWGDAVSPPLPQTGGVNMWGTTLAGDYGAGACTTLTSPTITLPGAALPPETVQDAQLSFSLWRHTDSGYDGAVMQISTDGGATWDRLVPDAGYDRSIFSSLAANVRECLGVTTSDPVWSGPFSEPAADAWIPVTVDLTQHLGHDVQVRFVFASHPVQQDRRGVYLDDFVVALGIGADNQAPETPLGGNAAAAGFGAPTVDWDALGTISDERLLDALKTDPTGTHPAVVLGPDRERVYEADFPTRADALSHLAGSAEPFFRAMDAIAQRTGATVTHRHVLGPAVSIEGNLATFDLVGRSSARNAALDDDGSIRLIDPIADDGVHTANTAGRQMLQAEDIWAAGYLGEGITISIIDTGIDASHEAFLNADGSSRVVDFVDYVNGATTPYDDHGHGTHVGATAAGSDDFVDPEFGAFQEKGVAPKANLLGAKFLSSGGSGSISNGILALEWSYDNGADLTSNSWGSSCGSGSVGVIEVVGELTDLGMLSVFAAGNSGPGSGTIGSPACGEDGLSVGAVNDNEAIASFSSRGPCSDPHTGTGSRICPDVVAKGVGVRSAIPRSGASNADPSGYKTWQGTSMATPHIAGAVALAEQMKRDITGVGWDTAARAEETLFKLTSKDLGATGEDNTYGWGLPQLLEVQQLIDATDEANVVTLFDVTPTLLRQGDTADITFRARNLGGATASGHFAVTIEDPAGAIDVLTNQSVSLGLLDQEGFDGAFVVNSNVAHGNYTVEARFDYTWTNESSGQTFTESIVHQAIIEVKRVSFDMAIAGFAETAHVLVPQALEVTATNTGNEDGTNVRFEFTVPDSYEFVPGDNYDPFAPLTRYADPAPDRVHEDETFGRVTLVFEVGDAPVGTAFSFTTNLAPTELGSGKALLVAKYTDGAGNSFNQGASATQTVGLPLP